MFFLKNTLQHLYQRGHLHLCCNNVNYDIIHNYSLVIKTVHGLLLAELHMFAHWNIRSHIFYIDKSIQPSFNAPDTVC